MSEVRCFALTLRHGEAYCSQAKTLAAYCTINREVRCDAQERFLGGGGGGGGGVVMFSTSYFALNRFATRCDIVHIRRCTLGRCRVIQA